MDLRKKRTTKAPRKVCLFKYFYLKICNLYSKKCLNYFREVRQDTKYTGRARPKAF